MLKGDIENFKLGLANIMLQTASIHDMSREPEAFYHGLLLGLTASLDNDQYEKKSNKESGYGRYDIALMPRQKEKCGFLFELKRVKSKSTKSEPSEMKDQLVKASKDALVQINQSEYLTEFKQQGIKKVLKLGLAFSGKNFRLEAEEEVLRLPRRDIHSK